MKCVVLSNTFRCHSVKWTEMFNSHRSNRIWFFQVCARFFSVFLCPRISFQPRASLCYFEPFFFESANLKTSRFLHILCNCSTWETIHFPMFYFCFLLSSSPSVCLSIAVFYPQARRQPIWSIGYESDEIVNVFVHTRLLNCCGVLTHHSTVSAINATQSFIEKRIAWREERGKKKHLTLKWAVKFKFNLAKTVINKRKIDWTIWCAISFL